MVADCWQGGLSAKDCQPWARLEAKASVAKLSTHPCKNSFGSNCHDRHPRYLVPRDDITRQQDGRVAGRPRTMVFKRWDPSGRLQPAVGSSRGSRWYEFSPSSRALREWDQPRNMRFPTSDLRPLTSVPKPGHESTPLPPAGSPPHRFPGPNPNRTKPD